MSDLDNCPCCGVSFNDIDIYEHFLATYREKGIPSYRAETETLEEAALESASRYGWTEESPKCFRREFGCEFEGYYDGIVIYKCPDCGYKWKRFDWVDDKYLL